MLGQGSDIYGPLTGGGGSGKHCAINRACFFHSLISPSRMLSWGTFPASLIRPHLYLELSPLCLHLKEFQMMFLGSILALPTSRDLTSPESYSQRILYQCSGRKSLTGSLGIFTNTTIDLCVVTVCQALRLWRSRRSSHFSKKNLT